MTEVLRAGVLEGVRAIVGPGPLGDAVAARLAALGADAERAGETAAVAVHDASAAAGTLPALDEAWAFVRAVRAGLVVLLAPRADEPARAGLENLARTLSVEWSGRGSRVVAVCPGPATSAAEVAELVAFLASPAGGYYSGCRFDLGAL